MVVSSKYTDMSHKNDHRFILITVFVVMGISALYVTGTLLICGFESDASWCAWLPHLTAESVIRYIKGSGPWGVAVSIGLMIVHSFVPFPAEFITIANGMVYGQFWGVVVTWTGAMLGAYLAFGLSRKLGRPYVSRMLKRSRKTALEHWFERYGGGALFVSRFIPVISFNLINYAAGLTGISWWTFTWATGLGILPITILMVFLGSNIGKISWQVWFLFLAAGLGLWLLGHILNTKMFHAEHLGESVKRASDDNKRSDA